MFQKFKILLKFKTLLIFPNTTLSNNNSLLVKYIYTVKKSYYYTENLLNIIKVSNKKVTI